MRKKSVFYKTGVLLLTAALLTGMVPGKAAVATEAATPLKTESKEVKERETGCIPDTPEVIAASNYLILWGDLAGCSLDLPDKVDLSESPYFPKSIGDQKNVKSGVSFATVYYQYTYEVNRWLNIAAGAEEDVYSPKYIYNYINGGRNVPTTISGHYELLERMGCVPLKAFPYETDAEGKIDWNEWCTDTEAMRDALSVRASGYYILDIPGSSERAMITSEKDLDLNLMKRELSDWGRGMGKVLVASSAFQWDSKAGYGEDSGKNIAYRCKETDGEHHAIAIVGYDDNIQCDVNGNGIIEPYEKGAFKAVNSWGESFDSHGISSEDGYFWILYDALNGVSANQVNDWESACSGTRCTAFDNENASYELFVEEKEVDFVGQLDIATEDKNKLQLSYGYALPAVEKSLKSFSFAAGPSDEYGEAEAAPYSGKLVFDYFNAPIEEYFAGYDWYVNFSSEAPFSKADFAITDNQGNVIEDFGALQSSEQQVAKEINLKKGDSDYDGKVTPDDALLILQYLAGKKKLSCVQDFLSDADGDWNVTPDDALHVLQIVAGKL